MHWHHGCALSRGDLTLRGKGAADPLAVRPGDLRRRRHRHRHAVLRGRRQHGAMGDPAVGPLRRRPRHDARGRALRHPAVAALGLSALRRRALAAGDRRLRRHDRHGRAALDRSRLHQPAALRGDEDRAGAGACPLLPRPRRPRTSAGPRRLVVPAADGAGAGRAGAEAARSRHRDDAAAGRRRMFFAAGVRLWMFAVVFAAGLAALPVGLGIPARLPAPRVLTFLDPESDPLGSGYHILQSKIALGSGGLFGKGLPAGHPEPSQLPAREADRLHLHHAGRGVRAGRLARHARALRADPRLLLRRSRCRPRASSAGCWRSASPPRSSSTCSSTWRW